MSNSERLSKMQKNLGGGRELLNSSKFMDKNIITARAIVIRELQNIFPNIDLFVEDKLFLHDIVNKLKINYPADEWNNLFDSSFLKPDGGILYLRDKRKNKYPILIAEMKKQGTNDKIITETGKKQAKGNAVERLGKNVIGLRKWLSDESIFPFICFGWGCDFSDDSSILDRVITIAQFGHLNKIYLHNTENTNRGSFFFRNKPFENSELKKIMLEICENSIYYYFSKYNKINFI